ncbi:hypothetical protein C8Q79DRAFT_1008772 [Trametes meyenii]|nr:hypothetical protein C8Q79DRAFT_1008772 [Trametes meyenii]
MPPGPRRPRVLPVDDDERECIELPDSNNDNSDDDDDGFYEHPEGFGTAASGDEVAVIHALQVENRHIRTQLRDLMIKDTRAKQVHARPREAPTHSPAPAVTNSATVMPGEPTSSTSQSSTTTGSASAMAVDPVSAINGLARAAGRQYTIMARPWPPPEAVWRHPGAKTREVFDPQDSDDRYPLYSSKAELAHALTRAYAAELHDILPAEVRAHIDNSQVVTSFRKGANDEKSKIVGLVSSIESIQHIFGHIPGFPLHIFSHANTAQLKEEDPTIQYWRGAPDELVPPIITHTDHPGDLGYIFMNEAIAIIIRLMLFKKSSMKSSHTDRRSFGQNKEVAKLEFTMIAWAAVLAEYILSKDSTFEPEGRDTHIDYVAHWAAYMEILISGAKGPRIPRIVAWLSERVFVGVNVEGTIPTAPPAPGVRSTLQHLDLGDLDRDFSIELSKLPTISLGPSRGMMNVTPTTLAIPNMSNETEAASRLATSPPAASSRTASWAVGESSSQQPLLEPAPPVRDDCFATLTHIPPVAAATPAPAPAASPVYMGPSAQLSYGAPTVSQPSTLTPCSSSTSLGRPMPRPIAARRSVSSASNSGATSSELPMHIAQSRTHLSPAASATGPLAVGQVGLEANRSVMGYAVQIADDPAPLENLVPGSTRPQDPAPPLVTSRRRDANRATPSPSEQVLDTLREHQPPISGPSGAVATTPAIASTAPDSHGPPEKPRRSNRSKSTRKT